MVSINLYTRGMRTNRVDLSNLLQWVYLVNLHLELTRLQPSEQLIGVVLELLSSLNVAKEGGASNLNTLWGEFPV